VVGVSKTPEEIFNAIMVSSKNVNLVGLYKWAGTDIVDTRRIIQTEDGVSVFENLLTMCEKFNKAWIEMSTDETGQKWIYLRSKPINNGKFIRKGQGLKSLDITFDTSSIFTRMYGYGENDVDTGNPIEFIGINPEGKAYAENISYFLAKGMTKEEIYASPRCVQETDYTDSSITSKEELFRITKEELAKVCVPNVQGHIEISDFSAYENSSVTEPMIGEQIIVIDQDISYNIPVQIQSIERKYTENPFDVTIDISNTIKYNSILRDLQHTADTVKSTTVITNDGKIGINTSVLNGSVDASLVKTGILKDLNGNFSFDLTTGQTNVLTQPLNTKDKQIANTEFVSNALGLKANDIDNNRTTISKTVTGAINELNARQNNVVVGAITTPITVGTGNTQLAINGLGNNPIIVTNGDYSLNTAQILGVKNIATDTVIVFYSNAIEGNCKFNYTYSK